MLKTMKQNALEPGLLYVLRVYAVLLAIFVPLFWRGFSPMFGVEGALGRFLTPSVPILLFLVVYLFMPWWRRRMGRLFLPIALVLLAAQGILANYLTVHWSVPPPSREPAALSFMLRAWVSIQFLVLFVAWQYGLAWVMVAGIGLSLLDAALYFPFLNVGGPFYGLYTSLVVRRLSAVTAVGLGFAWLMKSQREQRAALAEANRKLARYAATTEQLAVSQERNRLARELHDTLAHSLSAVMVQLEAAQSLWEVNAAEARQSLDQAFRAAGNGFSESRRALQSLRATPLEDLGLALAVRELAESTAKRANLTLELDVQNQWENLPPDVEQCVYRVAQEAMTNVVRHAQAKSLRVSLRHDVGALTLTIADDGRGFDPAEVDGRRYGLQGLRERAELVRGTLDVQGRPGSGTSLTLTIKEVEP